MLCKLVKKPKVIATVPPNLNLTFARVQHTNDRYVSQKLAINAIAS